MSRNLIVAIALGAVGAVAIPTRAIAQTLEPVTVEADRPLPNPDVAEPDVVYVDAQGRPLIQYRAQNQEPQSALTSMRGTLGVNISELIIGRTSFNEAARTWGYDGFGNAAVFAVDGGVHLNRFILLGARAGYLTSSGGTAVADGANLRLDAVDVDLIARFGVPIRLGHSWVFFPGVQLEGGIADAWTTLRGETNSALLGRFAGQAMLMFASRHVGLSARMGYQFAQWDRVDGSDLTISLSGVTLTLGIELRL